MEAAMAGVVANAIALVTGVGIGLGSGYLLFPAIREARVLRTQLDAALKAHEQYKASVDSHFRKTADLVGQMTRSYAAVYDHLAVGARTFCDDAAAGSKLGFGPLPGMLASPDLEAAAEAADVADAPAAEVACESSADAASFPAMGNVDATPPSGDASAAERTTEQPTIESAAALERQEGHPE